MIGHAMKVCTLTAECVYTGNLVLVNEAHPIRKAVREQELVAVDASYPNLLLQQRAKTMLVKLLDHIEAGSRIVPVSGYRTRQEQVQLYEDSWQENGEQFTRQYVALPDCSEHQTGLAIDLADNKPVIDFIRPSFPYSGICQTFRHIAADYGFIERYSDGKQLITGIAWEPWHFRYVGYPHSFVMKQHSWALEEYIEQLKHYREDGQHLVIEADHSEMEIYYVPCLLGKQVTIELPSDRPYQISGNNVDGVVITLWTRTN